MAASYSSKGRSLQEEKETLKIQIEELNRLKTEIKHCLNTPIFNSEISKIPSFQTDDLSEIRVKKYSSDVFTIKNELFDFSGIRCIKFTKDEYIFQFVAQDSENRTYVYSVQFFKVDNKGVLGKWIMPFFVDMDLILRETPLDNIAYGVQFIRNCKRYIDCYYDRMNQFIALKKSMKGFSNYTLTADLSYRYIHLILFRVYNVQSRDYVNIIVYLVYDFKETRPKKIMVDSVYGPSLPKVTEKGLKTYLKSFRKLSLNEALESILKTVDDVFCWENTDIEEEGRDSSLEVFVPRKKRRRRTVDRDSESEICFENELKKNKRRNISKQKLSGASEEETGRVFDLNKARKSLLKKKKKEGFLKSKLKESDISTFFTKKNKDKSAPELKDSNQSERDDHSEEHRPFERKMVKPTETSVKRCVIEVVPLEQKNKRIVVNLKNTEKKDAALVKIKELDTFREGRVLRSTANSLAKVAPPKTVVSPEKETDPEKVTLKKIMTPKIILSPKKDLISKKVVTTKKKKALKQIKTRKRITTPQKNSSPKKVVPLEKDVTSKKVASKIRVKTSKKIVTPKKVAPLIKSASPKLASEKAAAPEIIITSNTSQPQMKQTKIKFPISTESSPSADMPKKRELDYKEKLSKTKVVTSTPMRFNRKDLERPFRLDISEIELAKNPKAAKAQIKSNVSLHEMQKIRLTRRMAAKRGV